METTTSILMRADPDIVFRLASQVERWAAILPHYRRVEVLREDGARRTVRMAASRDGIPVQWTAVTEAFPAERRITFRHVGGVTRGMDVEWRIAQRGGVTHVEIWHAFRPRWPVPDPLVHAVVGQFFVDNIARKTLRRIRDLAEAETRAAAAG